MWLHYLGRNALPKILCVGHSALIRERMQSLKFASPNNFGVAPPLCEWDHFVLEAFIYDSFLERSLCFVYAKCVNKCVNYWVNVNIRR